MTNVISACVSLKALFSAQFYVHGWLTMSHHALPQFLKLILTGVGVPGPYQGGIAPGQGELHILT